MTFNFKNHSGKTITKAFKIGAITSSNDGIGCYVYKMPENMLKELAGYDCTYAIEIQAEAEYQEIIEQKNSNYSFLTIGMFAYKFLK
ncbi:MAG: hypothetical protein V8Q92_09315, partial [Coprococcus comes]